MAEANRMTAEEVVRYLLEDGDGLDFGDAAHVTLFSKMTSTLSSS